MRIAEILVSAVARRLAYVCVAVLLAWCGIDTAHAQAPPNRLEYACNTYNEGCDEATAASNCSAFKSARDAYYQPYFTSYKSRCERVPSVQGSGNYTFTQENPTYVSDFAYVASECGAYGKDPYKPSECNTQQKCLARNASLASDSTVRNHAGRCVAGCMLKPTTPIVGVDGLYSGVFQYSGDACGAIPTAPPDEPTRRPKQECTPASGGMTFCLKPTGEHCYTSSNGRQNCWGPGETGTKDDGPVKQKRDPGTQPIPPSLQLPSGDNLQQSTMPKTQTTTITNTNNTTQTITTTTTNYQTQNGTNAGTKNSGESNTGDGTGKEGDKDKGSASGGGSCEQPPITTGDPVMGMVATQAWHTRCAVEAGNAAKVTGDVADCAQAFSVEGSNANAIKLRAMRAQICGDDTNGNKRPDWTETNGTEEPGPGEGDDEPGFLSKTLSLDNLDSSGFLGGAASCPQMGVVDLSFTQVDLSNASWWCPFVTMCRGILLLMGLFISVRLLME